MNEFVEGSTFAVEASSAKYGPATTPWGFPLMLAPVYALFGLTVLGFKLVVTTSYMAFLVAFFCLARTRLDEVDALILTAVMAFNVGMLQAQNNILSDLPFLWWSTLGLWLAERFGHVDVDSPSMVMWGAVLGLVVFAAAFTRPNGFLLFVPVAATQFLTLRATSSATRQVSPHACLHCHALSGLWSLLLCPGPHFPQLGRGNARAVRILLPGVVLGQSGILLLAPRYVLRRHHKMGNDRIRGIVALRCPGCFPAPREKSARVAICCRNVCPVRGLSSAPGTPLSLPDPSRSAHFCLRGHQGCGGKREPRFRTGALAFLYLAWIGLAGASLIMGTAQARTNLALGRIVPGGWQAGPFSAASQEMFAFIRQNTPADAVVIFFKPRAMRLFTQRVLICLVRVH